MIDIIIPMAGKGERFKEAGYKKPKPLIDVMGEPMIKRVIDNLTPNRYKVKFTFICLRDHYNANLNRVLNGNVIALNEMTEGAACTVLKAKGFISKNPLILASCDQLIDINIDDFIDFFLKSDGSLITFKSQKPSCSYVKVLDGFVREVAEKKVISDNANVGIYAFTRGTDFVEGAESMIKRNIRTNNEFYMAPIYNELPHKRFKIFPIKNSEAHLIGTPEDLQKYVEGKNDNTKTTSKIS
jgi:NDP-sugar pyrophosphorylase family protein